MPDSQLPPKSMTPPSEISDPLVSEPASSGSLVGRLLNVFAAPGEAFDQIKHAPVNHANWLAPAILFILASWLGGWLILSQDSIQQQLREVTDKALDRQTSHMSQSQAEQTRQVAEKYGSIGRTITAAVGPVVTGFGVPVGWGFFLWLVAMFALKIKVPYMKFVELVGLGATISVLEAIARNLLIVVTGNLWSSVGPVLLIKGFDPENTVHSLLALLNLMTFWI